MKHLKFFIFLCILTFTVSCGQQKKYIQYKVKKGETITEIASKLDMSARDLMRLNPDVAKKPKENTVIIIPNKKMKNLSNDIVTKNDDKKEDVKGDENDKKEDNTGIDDKERLRNELIAALEKEYKIHEVKKGDTFFSLTRFYNVSKEELIALNPILSEGLKLEQIIKIKPLEEVLDEDDFLYVDEIEEGISLKATLMLPFRAKELDTLKAKEIFGNSKLANIVTDFYMGAEIAIDSLRKQGVKIRLNVFDTESNSTNIKNILAENDLDDNDVIIGPLYSEEVQYLSEKIKTPIVFPIYSKNQASFNSKRIVKTSPDKNLFREKLLSYIKENFHDGNIIVVGDGQSASNFNSSEIERELQSHDSINSVTLITPKDGYIKKEKFTDVLKANMKNIVVMTTDDNVIVASAINSLISLPEDVTVRVFTFDKGSAFNRIDNLKLAKIEFTYVSDDFVQEDSYKAKDFNNKYLQKNGVLPSFYATRGFDVTYDVLMRLASGKSLKSTFDEGYSYRVESKFDYTNKLFKITENKGLFIVKFNPDLTLTRID
ncbi:amino acid ABC transporter substrate-binding protein [Polaribacter aestuariivivens]|uniref:amino acid ABC transporter substrate-binding protein n=1 Tax=Polaribacter aestuariivivens TaxID=2304626 RepID=UPI003F49ABC2